MQLQRYSRNRKVTVLTKLSLRCNSCTCCSCLCDPLPRLKLWAFTAAAWGRRWSTGWTWIRKNEEVAETQDRMAPSRVARNTAVIFSECSFAIQITPIVSCFFLLSIYLVMTFLSFPGFSFLTPPLYKHAHTCHMPCEIKWGSSSCETGRSLSCCQNRHARSTSPHRALLLSPTVNYYNRTHLILWRGEYSPLL